MIPTSCATGKDCWAAAHDARLLLGVSADRRRTPFALKFGVDSPTYLRMRATYERNIAKFGFSDGVTSGFGGRDGPQNGQFKSNGIPKTMRGTPSVLSAAPIYFPLSLLWFLIPSREVMYV